MRSPLAVNASWRIWCEARNWDSNCQGEWLCQLLAGEILCWRGLQLSHTFNNQNIVVIDKIMYHTSSSNEEISVQSSKIYLTESKFKCKYLLFKSTWMTKSVKNTVFQICEVSATKMHMTLWNIIVVIIKTMARSIASARCNWISTSASCSLVSFQNDNPPPHQIPSMSTTHVSADPFPLLYLSSIFNTCILHQMCIRNTFNKMCIKHLQRVWVKMSSFRDESS